MRFISTFIATSVLGAALLMGGAAAGSTLAGATWAHSPVKKAGVKWHGTEGATLVASGPAKKFSPDCFAPTSKKC